MRDQCIIANGEEFPVKLPASIEEFLRGRQLLPRSVVVEHNGHAVAPSGLALQVSSPGADKVSAPGFSRTPLRGSLNRHSPANCAVARGLLHSRPTVS